jgi:hypothetical protein
MSRRARQPGGAIKDDEHIGIVQVQMETFNIVSPATIRFNALGEAVFRGGIRAAQPLKQMRVEFLRLSCIADYHSPRSSAVASPGVPPPDRLTYAQKLDRWRHRHRSSCFNWPRISGWRQNMKTAFSIVVSFAAVFALRPRSRRSVPRRLHRRGRSPSVIKLRLPTTNRPLREAACVAGDTIRRDEKGYAAIIAGGIGFHHEASREVRSRTRRRSNEELTFRSRVRCLPCTLTPAQGIQP